MELENAKGTRDFTFEQMMLRQNLISTLRGVFERYGFVPLETPAIERFDVLASKYAGGAEILKETFKLTDQGSRLLGLRYDLTVPMCRFVGMNPELKMPFKRYQIQPVWRDGPIQLGRYREFMQCDVDIVGVKGMQADAEILLIVTDVFAALGLDIIIKLSSRKVLNGICETAGIESEKRESVFLAIDKLEKFGLEEVKKELESKGILPDEIRAILGLISIKGTNDEILLQLKEKLTGPVGQEGAKELAEIMQLLGTSGNIQLLPSLARGLTYSTGPIIEVMLKDSSIKSSVAGGERYDQIIGGFLTNGREYPATGISFGMDRIFDALLEKKPVVAKCNTKLYVIPIKTFRESLAIAQQLRSAGINTDIDLLERGISKNLDYANSMGIPFVLFVGAKELAEKKVKLRDMKTGTEELLEVAEAIKRLTG